MLDAFLEVAVEHEKRASAYHEMVQDFRKLPKRELHALAEGKSKLAYLCGGSDEWLEKYEDTPFHEQALALEQQSLELEIAREQKRLARQEEREAEREECDDEWRQQDAIRLKKRILDLELNKHKLQASGGGEGLEEDEGEEELEAAGEEEAEEAEEEAEEDEEEAEEAEEEADPVMKAAAIDPAGLAVAAPTALTAAARPGILGMNPALTGAVGGAMGRYAEGADVDESKLGPGGAAWLGNIGGDIVGRGAGGPTGAAVGRALGAGGGAYLGYTRSKKPKGEKKSEKKDKEKKAQLSNLGGHGVKPGTDFDNDKKVGEGKGPMPAKVKSKLKEKQGATSCGTKHAEAFKAALAKLAQPQQDGSALGAAGKGALVGGGLGAATVGGSAAYLKSKPGQQNVKQLMQHGTPMQRANIKQVMSQIKTPGGVAKQVAKGAGKLGLLGAGVGLGAYGLKKALSPSAKQAAALNVTPEELEQLRKEAFGGAMLAGLKGAGKFIQKSAPGVRKAFSGGAGKGMEALKAKGATGVRKASRWAGKNPGAAAALGAGALGTAALAGRASA